MSAASESMLQGQRSGTVFGLSLAELLLIVLFVIMLLLMFVDSENERYEEQLSEERERLRVVEQLVENQAVGELPENWSVLVTTNRLLEERKQSLESELATAQARYQAIEEVSGQSAAELAAAERQRQELEERNQALEEESEQSAAALAEAERKLQELEERNQALEEESERSATELAQAEQQAEDMKERNQQLEERNKALTQVAYQAQGGTTTICTHLPADNENGRSSVALATLWIQNERLVYLGAGIENPAEVIDHFLEPFDAAPALAVISPLEAGEIMADGAFADLNDRLNEMGDAYETDERANCRFAYDYYFDDGVSAERIDAFWNRYYKHARIDRAAAAVILARSGIDMADLAEVPGVSSPAADVRSRPVFAEPSTTGTATSLGGGTLSANEPLGAARDRQDSQAAGSQDPPPEVAAPQVELPRRLSGEPPARPPRARDSGVVHLKFRVTQTGAPTDITVVTAPSRILARAAVQALEDYRYSPQRVDGVAVLSEPMDINFVFAD